MARRATIPKGWVERDTFSKWCRRFYCSFQRAGAAKSGKQSYNRRDRRSTRQSIRNDVDDRI